jgi:hypothetical protein
MGMTFRLQVEIRENQVEPCLLNFAPGRFDGMGRFDMNAGALKRLLKPSSDDRFIIRNRDRCHSPHREFELVAVLRVIGVEAKVSEQQRLAALRLHAAALGLDCDEDRVDL